MPLPLYVPNAHCMQTLPTGTNATNETLSQLEASGIPHISNTQGVVEEKKKHTKQRRNNAEHSKAQIEIGLSGPRPAEQNAGEHRAAQKNPQRHNRGQAKVAGRSEVPAVEGEPSGPSGRSTPSKAARGQGRRGRGPGGRGCGQNVGSEGPPRGGGRRKQINARLTNAEAEGPISETVPPPLPRQTARVDNLTNRLIDSLRTPPYADCPICFNVIHPAQPIWSCSPSTARDTFSTQDSENTSIDTQCCYTPFHLKCIKSWASKSVKDMRDAYLARGEAGREGEWRCPGCQRKRVHVPSSYFCFCGSTPDPRPARLATPHSCGNPCSRPRACKHACSLSCHPGPCPPCQVTRRYPCHCGVEKKTFRCADMNTPKAHDPAELSCRNVCGRSLNCDIHYCAEVCHGGPCEDCPIVENSRCYCGKETKAIKCGDGEEKHSCVVNEAGVLEEWDGKFACANACGRSFDCGIHKCEKPCHPPSVAPPPCPRSPSLVTHCPCGKKLLEELDGGRRHSCTDPVATCGNMCMEPLDGCEHVCSVPCHVGPCPPCALLLIIPCRCGSTTCAISCHENTSTNSSEILCDKPCSALRACGRHRCNRLCCPLAALNMPGKGKGKRRQAMVQLPQGLEIGQDEMRWHECDLICDKMLGCGNHRCEERDHRGVCPPCLRSSFDEMICHCGRTIIEPPIPCGTRISCSYPCSRPDPLCGHPKSTHSCHEDPAPCPPCPFLTTRTCTCGKKAINNVRCSQEKVSCGTPCGKLLDCGFHHCERLCHGRDCGTCTTVCGKPRKLCLPAHHGCAIRCHAPASCPEDEPCQATATLRCPCGRLQQPSRCGRSMSNTAGREVTQQLKCTNECAIAKRNARLAEALGISQEVQEQGLKRPVTYSEDLLSFARANAKFCTVVETTLSEFVSSEKKSQILPHMHEARRKFVHDLAAVYRIDTQMIDQEPQRSVQLFRRIDTRIPKPLLSSVATPNSNLGRLVDLRASQHESPPLRPSSAPTNPPSSRAAGREWTSVVAAPVVQAPTSAWTSPNRPSDNRPTAANPASKITRHQTPSRTTPSASLGASTVTQQPDGTSIPEDWEND